MDDKEDFYKFLVDNSQELICFHEPNGVYTFVSPSITKIAGYKPEELIGKNPYDYFHPDDRGHIQKTGHDPTLEGNEKTFVEYRYLTKSGDYIWLQTLTTPIFNENGQISNLLTTSRDISNLINLRRELKNKETLLEEASFLSEVGAWEMDAETLELVQSNALFDILEFDRKVNLNLKRSYDLFPGKAKEKIQTCVADALALGRSWDMILPINTAKGNSLWIRSIGKPKMKFGKVEKIYGIVQNVTSQVEAQIKLESVIDTLTGQKNHLEDFNHIISHNLRSPVKNLVLLAGQLNEINRDKECQVFVDHINKISHSINDLLDELVDMVKLIQDKDLEMEEVKLDDVLKKTRNILNGQIHQLGPDIDIDLNSWDVIRYPKVYLESIVLNLMSNALKYSSPERKPKIVFKTIIENNRRGFIVSDNGLGIDMKRFADKLFKLNQTFHKNINGKGMGLFMIKKQIESMGGEISVGSEENAGTEFKVILEKKN